MKRRQPAGGAAKERLDMAILQEPLKSDEDFHGPSWQSELSFREWKAELEAARANWASAPTPLKSTLLLHGNDLTAATSWLISRPRDLTPQQQSFIRKSIARSYNSAAEEHRLQDAERKKRLKSWISFGATVSAFVLFLGLELALYDLWVKVTGATYVTQDVRPPTFSIPRMPEPTEQVMPAAPAPEEMDRRADVPAIVAPPEIEQRSEAATAQGRTVSAAILAEQALEEARHGDPLRGHLIALEALSELDPSEPIDSSLMPALSAIHHARMTMRPLAEGDPSELAAASISRDGKMALLTAMDGSVRWVGLDDEIGRDGSRMTPPIRAAAGSQPIVAHDDSSIALSAGDDGVRLWPAGTSQPVATLRGHEASLTALAMSRDRLKVATASWDETIRMWDAHTGRNRLVLRGHQGPALAAAFSTDGRLLATAGEDRTARVWNASSGASVAVLQGHDSTVQSVAFDQTGARVLTTSLDGSARLWDAATGRQTAVLRQASGPVLGAVFSASGQRVATSSLRGEIAVWDAADGTALGRHPSRGHAVHSFALSRDGDWLLIVTVSGGAMLKNSTTGADLGLLEAPRGDRIASAAFSADGRHVVAVTARSSLLTWPIPGPQATLLAELRQSARRCLSLPERAALNLEPAIPRWCTDAGKPHADRP